MNITDEFIDDLYNLCEKNITLDQIGEILAHLAIDVKVNLENADSRSDREYYYHMWTFLIMVSARIDRTSKRNNNVSRN